MSRRRMLQQKVDPPSLEFDEELSDSEAFRAAMQDVRRIVPVKRFARHKRRAVASRQEEDPAKEQLEHLENSRMEIHHHPDYVEGGNGSWDRRLLRRLRRGDFSIQENLDLHGFTQEEARAELDKFLRECCRRGLSCVRVVHGKGNNSPQGMAVLRQKVPEWLSTRTNARYVVAFTSASFRDGGSGATYVLLKRRSGSSNLPRRRPTRKRT